MAILRELLLSLDPLFIWAFRLVDDPWAGFFIGSFALNLMCVALGDATSILVRRLNRKVYGRYHDEMVRHHNLSVRALRNSDKESYKAVNKQAHEAFGKYFFSQAGAFTLSIWPLPFALAWMEMRFGGIALTLPFAVPGVGQDVLYPFFFIPIYIAVRILYGKVMRRFTFYQRIIAWTRHGDGTEMVSFVELLKPSQEQAGNMAGERPPDKQEPDGPARS